MYLHVHTINKHVKTVIGIEIIHKICLIYNTTDECRIHFLSIINAMNVKFN